MSIKKQSKLSCIINFLTFAKFRKPKSSVAVLRLQGVIGKMGPGRSGMTLEALNESIEAAFTKPKLTAVCLIINSPGGSPVQSEIIAARIIDLAKEKSIPVYSFVEDIAASGGYWLACCGDEIYASKSSIIGSIGVISSGFGLQEAIKKIGIERRIITQGINKSVLDPFLPIKKSDINILTRIQKEAHGNFIDYIKSRRKKLNASDEILFNGEFWGGESATNFGLIDGIDNMYNFIEKKFGKEVKIEYIKAKESWFKKKFMSSLNADDLVESLYSKFENELISSRFKIN
jgi:signal peptide peptidase SppA